MLELPRFQGTPKDGPVVQTRLGTNVEAFYGPEAGQQCRNRFLAYQKLHPNDTIRKQAIGGYNCAGMVWASRRAVLPNPADWERFLREDGYRQIGDAEVMVGDIVIYRSEVDREILHVGRVCALYALALNPAAHSKNWLPLVLSKLDSTLGEVIHRKDDISISGQSFTSHVFTDR